jgi:hypothetical protein
MRNERLAMKMPEKGQKERKEVAGAMPLMGWLEKKKGSTVVKPSYI